MDNTKKLMTSVTASALLLGLGATNTHVIAAPVAAWRQGATNEDPAVDEAQKIILEVLKGKKEETAMSLEEILGKVPSLNSDAATKALKKLVHAGSVLKTNKDKYYVRTSSGG